MTQEEQSAFFLLKDTCKKACQERNACVVGYKQMLSSDNINQMMATWRANWEDIVGSKYAEIIKEKLPAQYIQLKKQMNLAGVYLNDCPYSANELTLVIITGSRVPICIHGKAQAYVLGEAEVLVYDHAQIYNKRSDAIITLNDYSYGDISAGKVYAFGRSKIKCSCEAVINGAVECYADGGVVNAYNYRNITARNNTIVYSPVVKNIRLMDNAKIIINE